MIDSIVGFVGAGRMAEAIVAGLIRRSMVTPANVMLSDVDKNRGATLASQYGVQVTTSNLAVMKASSMLGASTGLSSNRLNGGAWLGESIRLSRSGPGTR